MEHFSKMSTYDQTPYFHSKCTEKGLPFPPAANMLNQIDQSRLLIFEKNLLEENETDRQVSEAFLDSLVAQYELTYQQRGTGKRKPTKQTSDGFQIPNKTSKAVHYRPEPTKINNQFEVLNSVEQMDTTNVNNTDLASTSKIKKPPPVIVQYNKDFEQLLSLLKTELHPDTTAEYLPNGQLKIKSTTNEERNSIMKIFQDHNIGYYTYGGQETANIKFVLKGLPPSFNQENIVNALADKQITLLNIRQLKRTLYDTATKSKEIILLPIWVLTIPRTPESTEKLKSLTGIHHIRVSIEPYKGNSSLLQCFRCQGLGHKAQFCTLTPKCVKCGQKHNTKECDKLPDTPATCVNCGGEHPANYRNCPRIMQYKKRQESRTMTQNLPQSLQMSSFPKLRPTTSTIPGFQRVDTTTTAPPRENEFEDIKSIFTFFKTDKFKQIVTSFKTLITDIKTQPDKMSKVFTLCSGIVDIIVSIFN